MVSPSMAVGHCMAALLNDRTLWKAVMILDAKTRVKVTSQRTLGKRRKAGSETFVVSVGRYDYQDRAKRSTREWSRVYAQPLPKPKNARKRAR